MAKALTWGFMVAVLGVVLAFLVGFVGQIDISLPGLSIVSGEDGPDPSTNMQFDPLIILLEALLLSAAIWVVGAAVRRRSVR